MMGPFMKSKDTTTKIFRRLLIALFPLILFSFYKNGIVPYQKGNSDILEMFEPLILVFIGGLSTYYIEKIYVYSVKHLRKEELKEYMSHSYAIFPGIFLSLIIPLHTPIWVLLFGCIVASLVGKMIYGGFGNNIFNPALIGYLFIMTIYSSVISSAGGYLNTYEVDTLSGATPLANTAMVEGIGTYETVVEPYGNLFDFFTGMIPGSVGETSALLCVVAFLYLACTKTIKRKIPMVYIATVFILTWIIGSINGEAIWYPIFQILSGGLLFGAIFMATDPVTSPTTPIGQVLYALSLGILTVLFRYFTSAPEGVMTSILTMNMLVFILDKFGSRSRGKFLNYGLAYLFLALIGIGLSLKIADDFKVEESKGDSSFEIIDVQKNNHNQIYTVTQKGNGGPIKASVTVKNGVVISIEILNHNETPSYYKLLEDANYLEKLLNNKNPMEVDTISGATISSNALRKMVNNVLQEASEAS